MLTALVILTCALAAASIVLAGTVLVRWLREWGRSRRGEDRLADRKAGERDGDQDRPPL